MDLQAYLQNWVDSPMTRITGAAAMVLFVLAMLFKDERKVKGGLALANLLAVYHLFALGSAVAAAISFAAFIRLGLAWRMRPGSPHARIIAIGFTGFYVVIWLLLYKTNLDAVALIATLIHTWAVFLFTGVRFRASLALAMGLWVYFDINVGAMKVAMVSVLCALAALYAWVRELKMQPPRI